MADRNFQGKTYLTPKEAATYLNLSPKTLEEWRGLKKGPRYHKLGKSRKAAVLYHRNDLDAWMARHIVSTDEQK
jgi:excisionase family DNA binding protein